MGSVVADISAQIDKIRRRFPVLDQTVNGYPLVYFDNAATTQKPSSVINAMVEYYQSFNSNIHRGVHTLAEKATSAFEQSRTATRDFINAAEEEEVIFTKGTTDGINLVASTYGRQNVRSGDEVMISGLEHHSNIVPWQMLCEEKGAVLKVIQVQESGELDVEDYLSKLTSKTRVVAFNYASNSLGVRNNSEQLIQAAHQQGAIVVIDGAQAMAHDRIDVQKLNCDFFAFSGHKMYGPTGVGVLYGRRSLLESMPPYQGGGEMISEVTFEKTSYNEIPYKFEAGTPNIADVIAFKEAISFITSTGYDVISQHEAVLLKAATEGLSGIDGIRIYGNTDNKVSVVSFGIEGFHPFDLGMLLDAKGIAVRTGHHCTQPLMARFGIEGTVRASLAVYNTEEEVERMVTSLQSFVTKRKG